MATLDVLLHMPVGQIQSMLERELRFSHVTSFKLRPGYLRVEHERMTRAEIVADRESCERATIIV